MRLARTAAVFVWVNEVMSNPTYPYQFENCVILKGHLGKAPVSRILHGRNGDTSVCNFSMATSKIVATAEGSKTIPEWHNVACYGVLAEAFTAAAQKGDFVYIKGELRTREFRTAEDNEASRKPRKVTEIVAQEAYVLFKDKKRIGNETDEVADEAPATLEPVDAVQIAGADDDFACTY